jgi:light-regulated signal transduction histidine kinase (bacteriophytochrome)
MYTLQAIRNPDGVIEDFRFGLVNQAVASYLGMKAEDIAGSLGSTYFPAYKTNGLFDRYVESMETGNPATFDLHYEDGYDNFFTIHVVPVGTELFGTFTEHTSLKRLQRELESSIAELKRSNASLEQFAHAASHDLQEPLKRITKLADNFENEYGDHLTDNAFAYIEKIKTAAKRMQVLIRDLLVFAEVGSLDKEKSEVDLDQLIQEVLQNLEVSIMERDAQIFLKPMGRIPGNSLHLQQMFQNLLSNSLKYSSLERRPMISIEADIINGSQTGFELGEFEIKQQYLHIVLKDNGQGFSNEDALRIFKIFQRLPQHINEYKGTGIGLAIVQRVVQSHKGYIKAEGIPGVGATFTIILPVT